MCTVCMHFCILSVNLDSAHVLIATLQVFANVEYIFLIFLYVFACLIEFYLIIHSLYNVQP